MINELYLQTLVKRDYTLSKEWIDTSIFLALCANMAIYFIFKNIASIVVLSIVFLASTIVLIRNRRYLPEHYNSLLVKSVLSGHWFFILSVALVLFQIKMKINFWLYIVEVFLLAFMVLCVILLMIRATKKSDYTMDFDKMGKTPKRGAWSGFVAYILASIISTPFFERFVWHFLSMFFFGIVLFAEFIFVGALLVFIIYLTYIDE